MSLISLPQFNQQLITYALIYRDEERKLRPRVPEPLLPISELTALEIEKYQDAIAFQSRQDAIEIVSPLPSLRTLLVSLISTSPVAIPYSPSDTTLVATGLYAELENTIPYYNLHPSPSQLTSRSGRQGVARPSQIVVAATTLVVVPTDLVRQWQDEIEKHLEESALRVLVLRTTKDGFRTAEEMARFDVVLVSLARFSDDDATLRSVHWKRLIVDEGHTLSGANRMRKLAEEVRFLCRDTRQCRLLMVNSSGQLRCECRWAVSGTPSTNLRAATATDEGALFALDSTTGGNETDFHRLGQLFSRFLHHPAFPKVEDWRHSITVPIFEQGRGAARLAGVLERVIVRNSPERVKEAYVLPPLVSRLVEIELGEAERKTYNALLAVFATNSILSQRTDVGVSLAESSRASTLTFVYCVNLQEDYLFAPKNKKYLDELTDNLAASSFFFASSNINRWLRGAVENSLEKLDSEKSLAWTVKDRRGLVRAVEVMQEALSDVEWQEIVEFTSIGLEVEGMDHDLVELFSGLKAEDNPRGPTILPLGQLVRLRRDLREVRKDDVAVWKDDEELREEVITFEERRRRGAEAPSTPAVKTTLTKKRKKAGEPLSLLPLPDDSVFRRITLGGSTSAKLNYVVDELRRYPEDKFVIFSSSLPDLIFASLSEAFDLLGITHSIFAGRAKNRDRGAMAARFNSTTASECQAILVDARLGGRGFCLTGASRVIMLEPIWQPGAFRAVDDS
jgi:SNF2 family DNA or RNA helicase